MPEATLNRDKELFARIAEGDEAAFEELYHLYLPELYPVIYTVVRTELVIKDIIQEVFLYLWMDREKLADIDNPRHWIFRITYNRSYTWLKKQIARERMARTMQHEQDDHALWNATEETVQFSEAARLVQEAIRRLPAKSQQIYRMSREQGLKPAAIATQMGMSVQVVKNSLYRSGKTIKTILAEQGIIIPLAIIVSRL